MSITSGLYNVVLKGTAMVGVQLVNSFYFNIDVNGAWPIGFEDELFSVGKAMWDNIKAPLRAVTQGNASYTVVEVFKASGDDVGNSGFYSIPSGEQAGSVSGASLPTADAWTFQYTRPSANFRHGWKRFGSVAMADTFNGHATDNALTRLATLAGALKAQLQLGIASGVNVLRPCLVQRVKGGQPVSPQIIYYPSTVRYSKIGHQDTRDIGRGS